MTVELFDKNTFREGYNYRFGLKLDLSWKI